METRVDPIEQLRTAMELARADQHAALPLLVDLAGRVEPPIDAEVHLQLGNVHRTLGQGQPAVEAYRVAAERFLAAGDRPAAALAWLGAGTSHHGLIHDLQGAEHAYGQAAAHAPDGHPIRSLGYALVAQLRLGHGALTEARELLGRSLSSATSDERRRCVAAQLARCELLRGDLREAERWLALADGSPEARWTAAALELERGEIASARVRFEAMMPELDDVWKIRAALGVAEADVLAGDDEDAQQLLDAIRDLSPQSVPLVEALLRIEQRQLDAAYEILRSHAAPGDLQALVAAERARVLIELGRLEEAEQEMARAEELLSDLPGPRAQVRVRAGLLAAAQSRWEDAGVAVSEVERYLLEQQIGADALLARLCRQLDDRWWLAHGVPESLLALRPDLRWVVELADLGKVLCATTDSQDELVIRTPAGEYLRYHVEDGEHGRYPGLPEAIAALIVSVWETNGQDRDKTLRFAKATGIRDPEGLVDALAEMSRGDTWDPVELHPFLR